MALGLLLIRCDFFYRKMMKKKSWLRTIVTWSIIALLIIFIIIAKFLRSSNHPMAISKNFIYLQPISSYYRKSHPDLQHDWNDHRLMKADEMRKGPGEHGEKVDIEMLPETIEKVFKEHGHNTMVSMKIALDRAIPDFRNLQCKKAQYRKYLPKVSVIIPFFDEHVTTILRTVTTVLKRTPPKLLKEIILVNDGSTKGSLHQDLMDYIKHMRWHQKVTILDMDVRAGVIWSRLAGARYASGDVLLFLDCHTEVGYNYLPPLIDPISYNYRAVVTPTLDIIDRNTFEIHELGDGRTIFDWNLHPQRVPLTKNEQESSKPYKTPIMYGAAFAMSAKFFWELKPDAGMIIYGGDQFEMSFKVNLCGGVLLESPCSRVAYIYRRFAYDKHNFDIDYKARNQKRVAEIWMDNFKEYVYSRHPERYENLPIGDISQQLALKKDLKCQNFQYFLDNVAPDLLERFPVIENTDFAFGTIRHEETELCVQATDRDHGKRLYLENCSENKTHPHRLQHFILRHYRDIQLYGKSDCLEVDHKFGFSYGRCHQEQGNQYFRYDPLNKHIFWGSKKNNICLDCDKDSRMVFLGYCDEFKESQKWIFGFMRNQMLTKWTHYGAPIKDDEEIKALEKDNHHIENKCEDDEVHPTGDQTEKPLTKRTRKHPRKKMRTTPTYHEKHHEAHYERIRKAHNLPHASREHFPNPVPQEHQPYHQEQHHQDPQHNQNFQANHHQPVDHHQNYQEHHAPPTQHHDVPHAEAYHQEPSHANHQQQVHYQDHHAPSAHHPEPAHHQDSHQQQHQYHHEAPHVDHHQQQQQAHYQDHHVPTAHHSEPVHHPEPVHHQDNHHQQQQYHHEAPHVDHHKDSYHTPPAQHEVPAHHEQPIHHQDSHHVPSAHHPEPSHFQNDHHSPPVYHAQHHSKEVHHPTAHESHNGHHDSHHEQQHHEEHHEPVNHPPGVPPSHHNSHDEHHEQHHEEYHPPVHHDH